jgi:hypothetical protein
MPKAADKAITNRRSLLSVLAAAVPAAAVATGSPAMLAAATEADPIFAAIETHRAAFEALQAAELKYHQALPDPVDLGYDGPEGRVNVGYLTSYEIDRIADAGLMLDGERERLHAALDESNRNVLVLARLAEERNEIFDIQDAALQEMMATRPCTLEGALALFDYCQSTPRAPKTTPRRRADSYRESNRLYPDGAPIWIDGDDAHVLYAVRVPRDQVAHKPNYAMTAAELCALLTERPADLNAI